MFGRFRRRRRSGGDLLKGSGAREGGFGGILESEGG